MIFFLQIVHTTLVFDKQAEGLTSAIKITTFMVQNVKIKNVSKTKKLVLFIINCSLKSLIIEF